MLRLHYITAARRRLPEFRISGTRTESARQARVHSRLTYGCNYLYAVYIISQTPVNLNHPGTDSDKHDKRIFVYRIQRVGDGAHDVPYCCLVPTKIHP